jgi:hypothetical protein
VLHWDGTRWLDVPTPDTSKGALLAVAALAADDVWAVGVHGSGAFLDTGPVRGLIEHWNGSRWHVVPTPAIGRSVLRSIAALSPNDV